MKAIINGKIVLQNEILCGKVLLYDNAILGIADEIPQNCEVVDAKGNYVAPGFVDIHIHGYLGKDASDASYEGICVMAEGIAQNGVTSFLPTTMTVSYDQLRASFETIRQAKADSAKDDWMGARVIGVNAEGPFLNVAKKGAQAEEHIRPGDAEFLKEYLDIIKVFSVAPEVGNNMECVREMAKTGVLVSIGHTCANYDQACAAFQAGVRHTTHLFNAQTGLQHRDPGVVGAALTDDRVSCELIADTFHVHKSLFNLVFRQKKDKLCLITDCVRAGGLSEGEYDLGGQTFVLKGIECRLPDGTIAGSVLRMNEAVRNFHRNSEATLCQAVHAASLSPAKAIGVDGEIGSIEEGKRADFVLLDENCSVVATIVGGKEIYRA